MLMLTRTKAKKIPNIIKPKGAFCHQLKKLSYKKTEISNDRETKNKIGIELLIVSNLAFSNFSLKL